MQLRGPHTRFRLIAYPESMDSAELSILAPKLACRSYARRVWLNPGDFRRMKVYAHANEDGEPVSLEVANTFLGRKGLVRIVRKIPGAVILDEPGTDSRAGFREREFCAFEIDGRRFIAEKPFGDNSRYLVAPLPPGTACPELKIVIDQFARQKWPFGLGGAEHRRRAAKRHGPRM